MARRFSFIEGVNSPDSCVHSCATMRKRLSDSKLARPPFTWGSADIMRAGDFRRSYIEALRTADKNDIRPLLAFARS